MKKTTLVLGASCNPERYSYKAIELLQQKQIQIVAIGGRVGQINETPILTECANTNAVHTVTLYLNAERQKPYYEYILSLNPKRIIFNPGTENTELAKLARSKGIECVCGCTLVMLRTNQY